MKIIALIGVNGKAGRFLVKEALRKKYKVRVLVRDSRSLKFFMHYLHENVEIIVGDAHSKEDMGNLIRGCEAVISTVGHLKNCGGFYSNITNNIIDVMKLYGVERYISVASGALRKDSDERGFFHKLAACFMYRRYKRMMTDKEEAVSLLKNSGLKWSVYRLPKVIDGISKNEVKMHHFTMKGSRINNRNLAEFLVSQIENEAHFYKMPFIWQ